uniref:Brevinin-1AVa n=2 Tax=Rana arvalis TaxID=156871 RepID=BR1A_RANAR|nr:RecName: Full=Brevinin-1AVa [Rana arvalis]
FLPLLAASFACTVTKKC